MLISFADEKYQKNGFKINYIAETTREKYCKLKIRIQSETVVLSLYKINKLLYK